MKKVPTHKSSGFIIVVDVYIIIQLVYLIEFTPLLRVLELAQCIGGHEAASPEKAPGGHQLPCQTLPLKP